MKINRLVVGNYLTNCYILSIDNKCLIIDPGDDYQDIINHVGNKTILGILITHSHFDHIGAVKYFNNEVYSYNNLKEKEYKIGDFIFDVIYTPGHTNDSICFYFKNEGIMFTGDFLFKDGIGRTDLGGNDIDMKNSLIKIKKYPINIKIYPGHGEYSFLN